MEFSHWQPQRNTFRAACADGAAVHENPFAVFTVVDPLIGYVNVACDGTAAWKLTIGPCARPAGARPTHDIATLLDHLTASASRGDD